MKILVADDDPMGRAVITHHLAKWGCEFSIAEDGAQAWEQFQAEPHNIVISDWMMPNMDGIELVRRIRELNSEHYTYVILLTAKHEAEDLVEGMEAGADDFLTKPFRPDELRVRLNAGRRVVELEHSLAEKNEQLTAQNDLLATANARMKRDLDAAARIQQTFLPKELPDFREARFAWSFRPCDELAGDMLNILPLGDRHVGAFVLDVTGHGVPAALLSVAVNRYITASQFGDGNQRGPIPVDELACRLNERFMDSTGRFVTMVYGVLDLSMRRFDYVTAGHPGPLVLPPKGEPLLHVADGVPIGVDATADYKPQSVRLNAGDRLFLFSDGVVEAVNPQGEAFSTQRLMDSLSKDRELPLETCINNLVSATERWSEPDRPDDDVSILAIEAM